MTAHPLLILRLSSAAALCQSYTHLPTFPRSSCGEVPIRFQSGSNEVPMEMRGRWRAYHRWPTNKTQKSQPKATTTYNISYLRNYLRPNNANTPPYFEGQKSKILRMMYWTCSWLIYKLPAKLLNISHACNKNILKSYFLFVQTIAKNSKSK